MKQVHFLGLGIFIFGFGLWLASFFFSSYVLTEKILEDNITKDDKPDTERIAIFKEKSGALLGKEYSLNVTFVNNLKSTLETANDSIASRYRYSAQELEKIAAGFNYPAVFSVDEATDLIQTNNPDKIKKFQQNGSWMEGREYEKPADMIDHLKMVADNVIKYGLQDGAGFSTSKETLFTLVKASEKGPIQQHSVLWILLTYGLAIIGALMYILPDIRLEGPSGIKNNHVYHSAMKNRGWLGILVGSFFILFYILLYFYPQYMTSWVSMVDPISQWIKNEDAGQFFLYGYIYTLCILVMGVRMIIKYRHSKYHIVRTISIMFFQLAFAFLIPELLIRLNRPYYDFKNIWPLKYDFFFDSHLETLLANGTLGLFMLVWGIALIILAVPIITFFFGKRWYCSWVCGCGGLAETLGDPFRHLSDKSLKAWKIERWMVHGVLAFAVVMTAGVLYTFFTEKANILGMDTYWVRSIYGAWIGAGFAGVVGTGFYPFMGNRVWCRFGCPLAAYLGIIQRFKSRFRITTNGGQCISCGNCSTYCEMGIDVRWYAQRGQNVIRSSCVGCGICASVCPRGVLKLENRDEDGRFGTPVLIGNDSIKIVK